MLKEMGSVIEGVDPKLLAAAGAGLVGLGRLIYTKKKDISFTPDWVKRPFSKAPSGMFNELVKQPTTAKNILKGMLETNDHKGVKTMIKGIRKFDAKFATALQKEFIDDPAAELKAADDAKNNETTD